MVACPNGHSSADPDYCDTCGTPLGATRLPSSPPASTGSTNATASTSTPTASSGATSTVAATTPCPSCGELNAASNLFCESCGLDFVTGQAPPPIVVAKPILAPASPPVVLDPGTDLGWTVTLSVDSEWFAVKGEGIGVPPDRPATQIQLRHPSAVIGRSRSAGAQPGVVIDDDHGISRRHSELSFDETLDQWSITDLSSTNGTYVLAPDTPLALELEPIVPGVAHVIGARDRVYVGAWTQLTLTKTSSD